MPGASQEKGEDEDGFVQAGWADRCYAKVDLATATTTAVSSSLGLFGHTPPMQPCEEQSRSEQGEICLGFVRILLAE